MRGLIVAEVESVSGGFKAGGMANTILNGGAKVAGGAWDMHDGLQAFHDLILSTKPGCGSNDDDNSGYCSFL